MSHSPPAQERMMKVREVLMRAVSREITWIQAADILGCTARSLRRWKLRYQAVGIRGLVDGWSAPVLEATDYGRIPPVGLLSDLGPLGPT